MFTGFQNIPKIPELKRRILITLFLLTIYRIGVHVPTPGIDGQALSAFFKAQAKGTLFSLFDMFTGGALENFSVFALGIMPYISASIILQLLTVVIPQLERLSKEGEEGRKKIVQLTRYGTVLISIIQGFMISVGLEKMTPAGEPVVLNPGWNFRLMTIITLTAGTAFIMWLGEEITERGIGNGISLIIFTGIVARIPMAIINTFTYLKTGEIRIFFLLIILVCMIVVVGIIIFVERGQRRIPVQYAKRIVGRKIYGGQTTHLPLKINTAGVIPPIFASSIMMFPATVVNFVEIPWMKIVSNNLMPGKILYELL
ncbi:MAG: preprotein translocase subunit SecY, partial [Thermodesulfobacteriota bacterium]|nr:preprotein translocase subunit SecY [Thermodesulfobacteriota bacterium]